MPMPVTSQAAPANDKAEILALIHGRQTSPHCGAPAVLLSRNLTIAMTGVDSAVCHGVVHIASRKDRGTAEDFWMREIMCLERSAGGWRIVREQMSAPFSMDAGLGGASTAGSRLRVDWAPWGTAFQGGC